MSEFWHILFWLSFAFTIKQNDNYEFYWTTITFLLLNLRWGTLTLKSLLLPVTCYCGVRKCCCAFVLPSFCLRYALAISPIYRAKEDGKHISFTTVLKRNYILGIWEMVFTFFWGITCILVITIEINEIKFRIFRIAFQAILNLRNFSNEIIVTRAFLHSFSSIRNKVNQPEINAYCYIVETISSLFQSSDYT